MQLHWLEQTKPFVGRSKEMSHVLDWLDNPQAPSHILYISGMGGIGKSSLMTEMMLAVQQRKWPSIWLDGRSSIMTPVGFL
ncbi:ATP-binding protein [Paenibacillus sp.]